jgi:hypothetical protein
LSPFTNARSITADHGPLFAPSPSDRALLSFVLATDDDLGPWHDWSGRTKIAEVEGATHDLLPALYKRLEQLQYAGDAMGRLRGIYRHNWTRSQQHRAVARSVSEALSAAGIPHLGPVDQAASELLSEPGVMPLRRPRVTVPYERSGVALETLIEAGWTITQPRGGIRSVRARLVRTTWELEDDSGNAVTVANHYNPALRDREQERAVWERSGAVAGTSARRAAVADLMFATLTDSPAHAEALRWAVGSLAIARAHPSGVDLSCVSDTSVARFLLPLVEARLAFLGSVDAENRAIRDAHQAIRELLGGEPAARGRGVRAGMRLRADRAVHYLGAAPRLLHRYGGVRGTWRYLRATGSRSTPGPRVRDR